MDSDIHISKIQKNDNEEGQLSLDTYQNKNEIVIVAPIAGIKQENVQTSITDDVLMIRGTRELPIPVNPDDSFTKECFWGNFSRSIVLPENVDTSKIEAEFRNAVLIIRIPKIEKVRKKIIKIKSD